MSEKDTTDDRTCPFCDGPLELEDINDHWLVLYCEECDNTVERAASKDLDGVSVGDLRNLHSFTSEE